MSDVKSKVNIIGILGIIGAILMIVSVFLNWVDINAVLLGETYTSSITGWDVFNGEDASEFSQYYYVPLVTLVCGVIAAIATVLPVASNNSKVNKIFGFIALALAVVTIVLMVLLRGDVVGQMVDYSALPGWILDLIPGIGQLANISVEVAYGFWLGIAGAALVVIGGIADIARKSN